MTGDVGFGSGGGEGTFATEGFSDLSVSVSEESLLPELELLELVVGFVVASAGFCILFSKTGDGGFGPGGGEGTFVTGGFSDLSVSVSDESLLLELELVVGFASPVAVAGLDCSSVFVMTGSSFLWIGGDNGLTTVFKASFSVSDSDELLDPLLELLDIFASFDSSDVGNGTLAFLCSSMVTLFCSIFPLSGLDSFFPSSVLAVVDSESLDELLDDEEDDLAFTFATAGGDGLFLGGEGIFVFFSDSESLDELLDFFSETKFKVFFFLPSESESEVIFLSFVSSTANFLFASVELVLELELFLIVFFFSSFSDSLEEDE